MWILNNEYIDDDDDDEESMKNGSICGYAKTYTLVYLGYDGLFHNNFPINNERMLYPYGQIRENATKIGCKSLLQVPDNINSKCRREKRVYACPRIERKGAAVSRYS